MAFDETTTISHPPEQVFSGLMNHDFHIYASDAFRAELNEFSTNPSQPAPSDTVSVNIQRTVNGEDVATRLPSAIQRFAKGKIQIPQDEACLQQLRMAHAMPMSPLRYLWPKLPRQPRSIYLQLKMERPPWSKPKVQYSPRSHWSVPKLLKWLSLK